MYDVNAIMYIMQQEKDIYKLCTMFILTLCSGTVFLSQVAMSVMCSDEANSKQINIFLVYK